MKLLRVDGSIITELSNSTTKQLVEYCALNNISLQEADLQDAYLGGADLRGANLQEADLQGAYLEGACLRYAKNIFTFNRVNGRTCFANVHGGILKIQAGCFWGTLAEFEKACKERYPNSPVEAYEAQIAYLKTLEGQIQQTKTLGHYHFLEPVQSKKH